MTLKTKPTPEQDVAIDRMRRVKRFVLADGTGKGKTLSALATFNALLEENPERRMLVVANKGSLPTWEEQIPEHTDFTYLIGGSHNAEEMAQRWWDEDPQIMVVTYPSITPKKLRGVDTVAPGKFWDSILRAYERCPYNMVLVLEEAHYCKSPGTKRYKVVDKLIRCSEYAWMLTATPVNNRIEDLYHIMNLLIPGIFGTTSDFYRKYCIRELKKVGWDAEKREPKKVWQTVGYKNLDELREKLRPYMLKRAMVMDVQFRTVVVEPTDVELTRYYTAAAGILKVTEGVRDFGARLPDLQMVVDNAVLEDREPNRQAVLGSKERALLEGLRESFTQEGKAVVVFCYFVATFERLKFVLDHAVGKLGFDRVLTIEAKDPMEKRLGVVRDLGPGDVLLMSSAGKESLNLKASDEIWMYNIPWSAGDAMQAVGRITRMDSEYRSFTVVMPVVQGTIDEYKQKVWVHKSNIFASVLQRESSMLESTEDVTKATLAELRKELLWKTKTYR